MDPHQIRDALERLNADEVARLSREVQSSPFRLWAPNKGPQAQAYASLADELLYGGGAGGGKLLHNSCTILTPKGFVRNGDLRPGDVLCDPSTGGQSRVVRVSPQGVMPLYRVAFDDGTHLDAGLEHLWLYRPNAHERNLPRSKTSQQRDFAADRLGSAPLFGSENIPWRVGTTDDLWAYLKQGVTCSIPLTRPLVFTKYWRPFEIDPYMYGLFLGDANLKGMRLTTVDPETEDLMRSVGARRRTDNDWYLPTKDNAVGRQMRQFFAIHGLRECRSWEKFVPESLKFGTIQTRLAVLQGLLDTDGTIDERGRVYFISTSKQLADDVAFLARTLGAKARIRGRQTNFSHLGEKKAGRPSFQVRIWHERLSAFFRLPRKSERALDRWNGGAELTRKVIGIERCGEDEATCIQVDSPSSLYIAGENLVVTHNSALIKGLSLTQHERSLIIRRESTQLRGMIDEIARDLGTRSGFNAQTGQWRIPEEVAIRRNQLIEFQGVPNPGDEERHQGIPHDLLCFDEVTQIPEYVVDYLSTWCRTTTPGQRCRVVLCSNPPTPSTSYNQRSSSGVWIIRRYAPWLDPLHPNPAKPGELRWYVTVDGVQREVPDGSPIEHRITRGPREGKIEIIKPKSRTFIPALATDNPYLGEAYVATLQKLPEPLRSALLYGDFAISLADRPLQLIPNEWLRAAVSRWLELQKAVPSPIYGTPLTSIGVDVARGGGDSTVIVKRFANYFASPVLIPTSVARTGPEVAARVLMERTHNAQIIVDAVGIGASAFDALKQQGLENLTAAIGSVKSQAKDSSGKLGFANRRSQWYWKLREALDPSSVYQLAIPDDPDLIEELLSMTWSGESGRIALVSKKNLIASLGRSPDRADALVLALSYRDAGERPDMAEKNKGFALDYARDAGESVRRKARWGDPTDKLPYPRR